MIVNNLCQTVLEWRCVVLSLPTCIDISSWVGSVLRRCNEALPLSRSSGLLDCMSGSFCRYRFTKLRVIVRLILKNSSSSSIVEKEGSASSAYRHAHN